MGEEPCINWRSVVISPAVHTMLRACGQPEELADRVVFRVLYQLEFYKKWAYVLAALNLFSIGLFIAGMK